MSLQRPTRLTDEMRLAAALETAKEVKRDCFDLREEDTNELAVQIASQARHAHMDGYELAKQLDSRCGWSPDTVMVEALDNWSSNARRELEKAQKAWRDETNPQPAFNVGDRVKTNRGKTGVVTDTNYQYGIAQYLMKEDGDEMADGPSQRRTVINYEDAQAADAASNASVVA